MRPKIVGKYNLDLIPTEDYVLWKSDPDFYFRNCSQSRVNVNPVSNPFADLGYTVC